MTLCVLVLTTVMSAPADQAIRPQPARPAAQSSSGNNDGRVIRTLPPVSFDASSTRPKTPTPFAVTLNDRQRSRAASHALPRTRGNVKTLCGMTVIEQSPDLDAPILLPPDRTAGAAVRRIEPQTCTPQTQR